MPDVVEKVVRPEPFSIVFIIGPKRAVTPNVVKISTKLAERKNERPAEGMTDRRTHKPGL